MKKLWPVLAALPLLLLAGCSLGQAPTAAEVVSRMKAAGDQLTSYTADVKGTTSSGGKSRTVTGREWVQKPDLFRADLTVDGHRVLTVLDGQTIYTYNQADNQVREMPVPSFPGRPSKPAPATGKAQTGRKAAAPGRDDGFAPLLTGLVQRTLPDYDVSLAGRETVAERPAWVLDLKPRAGGAAQMTMWVDARSWLPVKVTSVTGGDRFSWEFDNLRVNPAIPPAEFQFQVPAGASVQPAVLEQLQVTLSEARQPVSSAGLLSGQALDGVPPSAVQVILEERR